MNTLKTWSRALASGLFLAAVGIGLPFGHIYLLNAANLTLPLSVHLPRLAFLGLSVALLASFIQLAAPRRARSTVRAGLLVFGIFLWAESTLFIGNFGFFADGYPDWDANRHLLYLEILLAVLLAVILIRGRGFLVRRAGLIMFLLTISAAANLYGPWRAEQSRTKQDVHHAFTRKGLFELSADRNVLIFILDTYQSDVFADIVADDSSWRQVLDGFTYFPDATSAFPKTYASVPNILTGTAFDNSQPFPTYMREAFLGNSVPRVLKRNGFDVRYHSFTWLPYFAHPDVADNLAGLDSRDEVRSLRHREITQLSNLLMFRNAPFAFKPWVYNDSQFRLRQRPAPDPDREGLQTLTESQRIHSADNDAEDLEFLDEFLAFLDSGSDRPTCRVYHLDGAHAPFQLDPDMHYTGPREYAPGPFRDQSKAMLVLMKLVFERLRSVGAYDNSLIMIVGDHGNGELETLDIRSDALVKLGGNTKAAVCDDPGLLNVMRGGIPLMLAKAPEASGPLRISKAPVELADITATVVQVMDLDSAGAGTGRSLFEPEFDPHRKRLHRYYQFAGWGQDYIVPMTEYVIEGFSWDPGSWAPSARDLNQAAVASVQGDMAVLGRGGNLEDYPNTGWSAPLIQGRFIQGDSASIVFQVPEDAGSTAIRITLKHFPQKSAVPMRIYTDTELAGVVEVGGSAPIRHEVLLPDDRLTPGSPVAVRFVMEPGSNPGSQFIEVRLDYRARRQVWPIGTEVSFAKGGTGNTYLNYGWGVTEKWGTWTRGPQSAVSFSLDHKPRGDLLVLADLSAAIFGPAPPVRARILANGEFVTELEAESKKACEHVFRIPAGLVPANGNLDLVFQVENPRSPLQYGLSRDPRLLGVGLRSLLISE